MQTMNDSQLQALFKIVEKEAAELFGVAGPVDEAKIDEAEKLLGLPIRGSYREFIKQLGSVHEGFLGLAPEDNVAETGVYALTKSGREENDFEKEWIMVLANFEDGILGALDTSQMNEAGEAPVLMMNVDPIFEETGHTNLQKYADSFYEALMHYYGVSEDDLK